MILLVQQLILQVFIGKRIQRRKSNVSPRQIKLYDVLNRHAAQQNSYRGTEQISDRQVYKVQFKLWAPAITEQLIAV